MITIDYIGISYILYTSSIIFICSASQPASQSVVQAVIMFIFYELSIMIMIMIMIMISLSHLYTYTHSQNHIHTMAHNIRDSDII